MSQRRRRKAKPTQKGIEFEKAVAAMQQLLDPAATVTHNETLIDRIGHARQFDVVLRGKVGGHDILGVIECKDISRRVGTPEVNAFADKAHNVRANLSMMVSRNGFTKPALELAAYHGIGTFSLLSYELAQHGFSIGAQWYAEIYSWTSISVEVFYHQWQPAHSYGADQLYVGDQHLLDWVLVQLYSTYLRVHANGVCTLTIQFPEPRAINVAGVPYEAKKIVIRVVRVVEKRWKHVLWTGKAIYNWGTGQLTLPQNCELVSQPIQTDVSDWELFDGEIPAREVARPFECILSLYQDYGPLPVIKSDCAEGADVSFDVP